MCCTLIKKRSALILKVVRHIGGEHLKEDWFSSNCSLKQVLMFYYLKTGHFVNTVRICVHICKYLNDKWALHFGTLAIIHFSSSIKLFQATINTATLQASLLSNISPAI